MVPTGRFAMSDETSAGTPEVQMSVSEEGEWMCKPERTPQVW